MISGTAFTIEGPQMVEAACRGMRTGIVAPSEIDEIQSQCESERALCLACDDGMLVVDVRSSPSGDAIEMFIWLAVGFKHGAVERQDAAMRAIARDLGATTVAFQSRRRGWGRRLGPEWHRRGKDEFVRQVDG